MTIDYEQLRVVAFDLDGTLAESKQKVSDAMGRRLAKLSMFKTVAIISGGDFPQYSEQLLPALEKQHFLRKEWVKLLPTCGAKFYEWTWDRKSAPPFNETWVDLESGKFQLTTDQIDAVVSAISDAETRWDSRWFGEAFGEKTEVRGTQITYSALGQRAPGNLKAAWDPDGSKRQALKTLLEQKLAPHVYSVRVGGSTSIDITMANIDKAFAIGRLRNKLNYAIRPEQILFVGDALFDGGNDAPVKKTGCHWLQTSGPEQTAVIIDEIIIKM
jgi:phosphomannomutase